MDQDKPLFGLPTDFNSADVTEHEVVEHPAPTNPWTAARRVVLQILYEIDSAGHLPGEVIEMHLGNHDFGPKVTKYMRKLVQAVVDHREALDVIIQQSAPEWPLQYVAIIDRNILRLAVSEFAILTHTPLNVAVDEAVQLARIFGAEGSTRFVNGVLGTLADNSEQLRQVLTGKPDPTGDKPTTEDNQKT